MREQRSTMVNQASAASDAGGFTCIDVYQGAGAMPYALTIVTLLPKCRSLERAVQPEQLLDELTGCSVGAKVPHALVASGPAMQPSQTFRCCWRLQSRPRSIALAGVWKIVAISLDGLQDTSVKKL